jgi:hypothetical protein
VGLLTLDGGRWRDGRQRTGMAAGSGSRGRRRFGGPLATENGTTSSARHEETSGGVGLLREAAVAAVAAHWPAARGSALSGGGARQARIRARRSLGTRAK